jgi:Ni,Fe-hydrogenase I small subunit
LKQEHLEIQTPGVNKANKVGCGESFIRSELPKIEDNLILELFKVKTMKEVIQLIQSDNFKEVRQEYESNIDSNFYS